jgi:Lantibiotic biosynthesis dehydratase C-term
MNTWLSAHIFYHDEQDSLLLDCLRPLVRQLEERELIDSFFFIRYWEGGPHIRLRLGGDSAVLEAEAKPLLDARVAEYLIAYPSMALIQEEEVKLQHAQLYRREYGITGFTPLYPNNSVQYLAYTPEHNRYGGRRGVEIAESHFENSSRIAFRLLEQTRGKKRLRQTVALRFALALALSMGVGRENLEAYFINYYHFWLYFNELSEEAVSHSFRRSFEGQKQEVSSYIQRSLELMDDWPGQSSQGILYAWISDLQAAYRQLKELEASGQLSVEMVNALRSGAGMPVMQPDTAAQGHAVHTDGVIDSIAGSYLHMFHNRLGISPIEEAYSAFLISQTLALLKEKTDEPPKSAQMEQRTYLL